MIRSQPFRGSIPLLALLASSLLPGCADMDQYMGYDYSSLGDFWGEQAGEKIAEAPSKPATVPVQTHNFTLNGKDSVLGGLATIPVQEGDTLLDIARHYGVGYQHIVEANPGVDTWIPVAGVNVLLPLMYVLPDAKPNGVVINIATMRLFYFKAGKPSTPSTLSTWPIGIGREGRSTPLGAMSIARKTPHPTWYVPDSIRRTHAEQGDPLPPVVPPGPDNPLGDFALYLSKPSYLIHGTNKPFSIGLRASNGCIRLYPEDIEQAFKQIPVGAPVAIVNQPYLLGWLNGVLYLEAHEPYEELDDESAKKNLRDKIQRMVKDTQHRIDWKKVEEILKKPRGIPIPIFENTPRLSELLVSAPRLEHPAQLFGQPAKAEAGREGWYVKTVAMDEYGAKSLAAQMNHFGPRIPAYAAPSGRGFQVIGGPFAQEQAARKAQSGLSQDFNAKSEVVKLAKSASAPATAAVPANPGAPAQVNQAGGATANALNAEAGKPPFGTHPATLKADPTKPAGGASVQASPAANPAHGGAGPKSEKSEPPKTETKAAKPGKAVAAEPPPAGRKPVRIILKLPQDATR